MNFHTWTFAVFFLIVYVMYSFLRCKWQNRLLLAASYLFYGFWDWRFLFLLLTSTITDYICGRAMGASQSLKTRKRWLFLSLTVNLGLLGFFKYLLFLCDNIAGLLSFFGIILPTPSWNIILPVGISFYTFQTLSYTIDVYRSQIKPVRNFWDYALFVSFFPQLLAGPIERARSLLPQIQSPRTITSQRLSEGFFLIYWGFFKKIFIADNLGTFLHLYGNPSLLEQSGAGGGMILITGYAFLFQLYCDFSAYSDIARGLAMVMGFELMENFKSPLFASNVQEVWARWHISLTTWIRDYVYYPLALKRFGKIHINDKALILIVFLIIGLWHGASWNFVLWGGFHGALLAAYAYLKPKLAPLRRRQEGWTPVVYRALSVFITFHLGVLGALLFRAENAGQILLWSSQLFGGFSMTWNQVELLGKIFLAASPMLIYDLVWYYRPDFSRLMQTPAVLRYAFLYITFYLVSVYGSPAPTTYIYFQF